MSKELYSKEQSILSAFINRIEKEEPNQEEVILFCNKYGELLKEFEILVRIGDRLHRKLNKSNVEIRKRNKEVELKNDVLRSIIKEYSFINSHLLRASLSRILGLAKLIEEESIHLKDDKLVDHFRTTCTELDNITKSLGQILDGSKELSGQELLKLRVLTSTIK